jgi:hypothetical protein
VFKESRGGVWFQLLKVLDLPALQNAQLTYSESAIRWSILQTEPLDKTFRALAIATRVSSATLAL